MKAAGNALAAQTKFDPKTRDLGHEGKAHWQQKAGEEGYVRNQQARGVGGNRSQGAAVERAASQRAKAAGEYARVKGSDPTAPVDARRTPRSLPPRTSPAPTVNARAQAQAEPPPAADALARQEAGAVARQEAGAVVRQEAGAVVRQEAGAVVRQEAGALARGGPAGFATAGTTATAVLWAVNIYFAWQSYKEGTRPNTPAPVGTGMIGGSEGEGALNFVGTLAGAPGFGTMLRQAAELGSTGSDPRKVWNAIKSGTATPSSIGMGIYFGAFR
jgi:hypothetical protein